ncbi:MAG TPA: hypothetical protein VGK14_05260 [Novimethylophilus sp.]|uniref:hypothetical protein n=1 Tax=Novimethylophilus sp. TaxID=2137426 RepID=UPI002F414D71
MSQYWTVIISLVAGAAGFLIVTFWFQPILRYRSIKYQIISDLYFYANAVNAEGLNGEMQERMKKRIQADRRNSSDLEACLPILPGWYKCCLKIRNEEVEKAVVELLRLSHTFDHMEAANSVDRIKKYLRIETDRL